MGYMYTYMTTVTGLSSCLPDLVAVYIQAAASFGKNLYLTLKENAHRTLMQLVRKHSQFEYQDSNGLRMVSINKNSVPKKNTSILLQDRGRVKSFLRDLYRISRRSLISTRALRAEVFHEGYHVLPSTNTCH